MLSPAWQLKLAHEKLRQKQEQIRRSAEAEEKTRQTLADDEAKYRLLLSSLEADRKRISALPQGKGRLPLKAECCKTYLPYLAQYLESKAAYRNEVLTQVMIWQFDLGAIEPAMKLARVAMEQHQAMPDRFKSSLPVFVADSVLAWAKEQREKKKAFSPYFEEIFAQLDELPLHDAQRAKYCKFAAETAAERGDHAACLALCDRAQEYDKDITVKTMRAKAESGAAKK